MGADDMGKKWDPKDCVQFTYKRQGNLGDVELYALDIADAVRTLEEHGFRNVDLSKLTRTGKTLSEHLASPKKNEEIK